MREMSAGSECSYDKVSPYGFIKYQVPLGDCHSVLVGMVIKLSGQVAHTNHVCGPELYTLRRNGSLHCLSSSKPVIQLRNNSSTVTEMKICSGVGYLF